jgi:hypothetical protein
MGATALNDRNGAQFNADNNAVGSNIAFTVVLADQAGNKFTLAPGLVALPVQSEGIKATYQFAVLALAPVAAPTDVIEIKGSATKTVRIRRIIITGAATAAGNMPVQLVRRSTASTGGGSALNALTAFKPDTSAAAATATVGYFSAANPTTGAAVGGIAAGGRVCLSALSTGLGVSPLVFEFDINACVLRGVLEFLYINFNAAAIPAGGVLDITVILQEDAS